jgi:hypothetical protein
MAAVKVVIPILFWDCGRPCMRRLKQEWNAQESCAHKIAVTSPCFQDLKHCRLADLFLFLSHLHSSCTPSLICSSRTIPASHRKPIPSINRNTAQYAAIETLVAFFEARLWTFTESVICVFSS